MTMNSSIWAWIILCKISSRVRRQRRLRMKTSSLDVGQLCWPSNIYALFRLGRAVVSSTKFVHIFTVHCAIRLAYPAIEQRLLNKLARSSVIRVRGTDPRKQAAKCQSAAEANVVLNAGGALEFQLTDRKKMHEQSTPANLLCDSPSRSSRPYPRPVLAFKPPPPG